MLFIVTRASLKARERTILRSASSADVVMLVENGTYLFGQLNELCAPVMALSVDCAARGLQVSGAHMLSFSQWVEVSKQHKQWVTL